jgi:hypothetical protein
MSLLSTRKGYESHIHRYVSFHRLDTSYRHSNPFSALVLVHHYRRDTAISPPSRKRENIRVRSCDADTSWCTPLVDRCCRSFLRFRLLCTFSYRARAMGHRSEEPEKEGKDIQGARGEIEQHWLCLESERYYVVRWYIQLDSLPDIDLSASH